MRRFAWIPAAVLGLLLYGCNDTKTTIKKETKVDSEGNEKVKIETKTETKDPNGDTTIRKETKDVKVEVKHND
jgi:hypothetical protein